MLNGSDKTMMAPKVGRKRSIEVVGALVVSAVALSMNGVSVSGFQSNGMGGRAHHQQRPLSQRFVVTDPTELLQMDFPDSDDEDEKIDLKALEDIYLLTTQSEGLSGDLIEEAPTKQVARGKVGARKSNNNVATEPYLSRRPLQFKGLTTIPDRKSRQRSSLTRSSPVQISRQPLTEERLNPPTRASRSSTMPGLLERNNGGRVKAFEDGIKIAERRSGRRFKDTAAKKEQRKKANGETMYKSSAAVPDSMVQFANEIHMIERITPKEEVVLGEQTQEALRLQKVYDGLATQLDREPTDEEWCAAAGKINMEAIGQAIEDGLEAKNKLVTANLRMVQGVVNVYIRNGLQGQYNAGDLMQEGIVALIRAAEKFDPSRGFRFSTYAMYWIRSAVKRSQVSQSRVVAVPQRLYENHKRIRRTRTELMAKLDRPPSIEELGEAVGMSKTQIERCLTAMAQECYSLDYGVANPLKPMNADSEHNTLYELVEGRTEESQNRKLDQSFLREDLIEALRKHLPEEEVNLLLLRYGLTDTIPRSVKNGSLTIAEISRIVGLKPDKVRRMINKSLKQLKAVFGPEWLEYERDLH